MKKYIWLLVLLFVVGKYVPQKDTSGNLLPRQCWGSVNLCWCEYAKEKVPFTPSDTRECHDKD